ncbi:Aste57867_18303 [Aphanomyces stellatus]|uniref:Aste57867_18303 protein n=1 Tax=Aphanomyces stellatus TaxID=120398 RepID=A0A485LAC2_9STRA|nr:hypothetical protein As57867_018241 [Aphanomyces stellatus]VFT95039.1 Aste57867_18303 [Aphanomyces stellatus]
MEFETAATVVQLAAAGREMLAASMHLQAVVCVILGAGLMSVYVYLVTSFDRMMRRKQFADRLRMYARRAQEERRKRWSKVKRMQSIPEHASIDDVDHHHHYHHSHRPYQFSL